MIWMTRKEEDSGEPCAVDGGESFSSGTDDHAVVCGDFCVVEDELRPVLRKLRAADINIVAIHHHMTHEQPRYLFLHYWGKGPAGKLATALKTTLGETKTAK